MADPTLSMTFGDLIMRVAEFLGVADYSGGAAAVPTDAHDLDLCKRYVNDGYRKFINANPRWQFLTPTLHDHPGRANHRHGDGRGYDHDPQGHDAHRSDGFLRRANDLVHRRHGLGPDGDGQRLQ
jgi:hypothetical protein